MIHVHCFLDDSGKEGQATNPYVCMAGYFGSDDAIDDLNRRWAGLLLKHEIRELHKKQLIPIEGEYKQLAWTIEKRDSVVDEFIDALRQSALIGIGIVIDVSAWRSAKARHPKENWSTAQQFCLERILRRLVDRMCVLEEDTKIALVFDTDPEFSSNRIGLFNALMRHDFQAEKRLSSITFGHPIYFPGLQCADLLAWETRKGMVQQSGGHKSTRRWDAMFKQMPEYNLEYIGEKWDNDEFLKMGLDLLRPHYERVAASAGFRASRR